MMTEESTFCMTKFRRSLAQLTVVLISVVAAGIFLFRVDLPSTLVVPEQGSEIPQHVEHPQHPLQSAEDETGPIVSAVIVPNKKDTYCPPLAENSLCDDPTTTLETTFASLRNISDLTAFPDLTFRDVVTKRERTGIKSPFPDSSCLRRDATTFTSPNGVGYVGGTTGPCGNDKAAKQSGTKEFGDVDSFIVAVRHKPPKEKEEEKAAKLYRNEAFRLDVLRAQFKSASNDISSDYHSVLHATAGGEVHLYSVEERAAAAKMKAGVECTSWWCDGKAQDGGVTFAPLVVDAVVAHVDASVPGFQEELAAEHALFGKPGTCGVKKTSKGNRRRQSRRTTSVEESGGESPSVALNRWRDWGELRYCLRGVFTHGRLGGSEAKKPGFRYRRVFLVVNTVKHAPDWLRKRAVGGGKYVYEEQPGALHNATWPLITIVPHTAFLPQCVLPTYSSLAIEPFLYRIPGLSRWFVYINDDTVVSRPMSFLDYFVPLPSVRQYAKVEALKRRHGEDVFAPILRKNDNGGVSSEVVFLEPSLFRENDLKNARLVLKKVGDAKSPPRRRGSSSGSSDARTAGPRFSGRHTGNQPDAIKKYREVASAEELLKKADSVAAMFQHRADEYAAYLRMARARLTALMADSARTITKQKDGISGDDEGAREVTPLRPSAFFDYSCGRYMLRHLRTSPREQGELERKHGIEDASIGYPTNVPLAPSGFFAPSSHVCYNGHLILKKLDGADPFRYFPHMSPLFDARMLRRLVGAPYIGEDTSAPGRVRGIFEEEFLGRTIHNRLRYVTDPTVPMLYQPLAASQRRYFTKVQLAAVPEVSRAGINISQVTTSRGRTAALNELIAGVSQLKAAAEEAANLVVSPQVKIERDLEAMVERLRIKLDDAETNVAWRSAKMFGDGYFQRNESMFWAPHVPPLPSNEGGKSTQRHLPGGGRREIPNDVHPPPQFVACAPDSELNCTEKFMVHSLSLRPLMAYNESRFFPMISVNDVAGLNKILKKQIKYWGRPLFVTFNDDTPKSGLVGGVAAMKEVYEWTMKTACGPACNELPPWETPLEVDTKRQPLVVESPDDE